MTRKIKAIKMGKNLKIKNIPTLQKIELNLYSHMLKYICKEEICLL